MALAPFHLAFPVRNLAEAERFYVEILGCRPGRRSAHYVDLDFFGHQLVAHLEPQMEVSSAESKVDGKAVPIPHFGVVLPWGEWEALAQRLNKHRVAFAEGPGVRYAGTVGEQGTFFFYDPSGNALEFKAFRNPEMLFAQWKKDELAG